MRHLILTIDFPPRQDGGIARSMDETARGLAAAGESVRVLTRGRGREVRRHDAAYPAEVTRLRGHHWGRRYAKHLRRQLPAIGPDERGAVVHTSTWEAAPLVQEVAAQFDWKVVIHAQGREVARTLRSSGEREAIRSALSGAAAVLPISRHVGELAVEAGADAARVRVITPSVDVKRIQGGSRERFRARFGLGDRPVILTLGRLVERKGQDTVIAALPAILKEIPEAVYVMAGKGAYGRVLKQRAKHLGVADHVVFTDFIADAEIPDAYAAADLYVMVSREGSEAGDIEGFGITYLEASAAGLPVVAGRSGGTADAVEEGVGGVLADPADEGEVGGAIVALLKDRARAKQMGEAGRRRVEKEFTLQARAERIIEAVRPV